MSWCTVSALDTSRTVGDPSFSSHDIAVFAAAGRSLAVPPRCGRLLYPGPCSCVHHRQQCLVLVIGAIDAQMIEAVLFSAGKHSLKAAQLLNRWLGSVLVNQQHPSAGCSDEEVRVLTDSKGSEISLNG